MNKAFIHVLYFVFFRILWNCSLRCFSIKFFYTKDVMSHSGCMAQGAKKVIRDQRFPPATVNNDDP